MGDDHISGLTRWHDFDYLKRNVEFLICRRENSMSDWKLPENICYRALIPSDVAPQSSSAIRTDPEGNLDYLSRRVREYVKANNLYN